MASSDTLPADPIIGFARGRVAPATDAGPAHVLRPAGRAERPYLGAMRIAELVNSLCPGGAERVVVDLGVALKRRGHEVSVACLHTSGELAPELERAGIEVLALDKGDGFSPGAVTALARFLERHRADILHTHNTHLHHYGAWAARLANAPVVVNTVHGQVNLPPTAASRLAYQASLRLTDRVVAVSRSVAESFEHALGMPERLVSVVQNGIEPSRFARIPPPPPRPEVVFGTVGRLVPVKNQRALIRAFAAVRRTLPGARLRLLGDGPMLEELRAEASSLGVAGEVDFIGGNESVPAFLGTLDVFVLSSSSEGMPIALLEAMAAGRPVVAPRVGGIPEVVSADCGWLLDAAEPGPLSVAMRTAALSPARAALGESARAKVLRSFTTERMTSAYESIFESLFWRVLRA